MKCTFCKMNYLEHNLKIIDCPNVNNRKISICKVCEKKHDINEHLEKKKDALYVNCLRYDLKNKNIKADENFIEICKLNAKLKRKIKNGK